MGSYIKNVDQRGHWYWVYFASNGEAISRSSESYVREADCDHSITLNKASAAAPVRKRSV